MKRALTVALILLLAMAGGAAGMAERQPRVGISCPYGAAGWAAAVAWSAEAAAEELGMNYVLKAAATAQEQAEDVEMLVRQDFDAILLIPIDDSLEGAARRAMKAGVKLYCFARIPGELDPDFCLCADDARIGALGAAYIGEKLGGSGKVVIVGAASGGASFARRMESCREALAEAHPGIEIVGAYAAEDVSREAGAQVMAEILAEQPRIDGVFSCADALSIGMLEALEAQGRLEEVQVMTGCGASRAYFECMDRYRDDLWLCTQTCSPYAVGDLLRTCEALLRGEAVEPAALPVEMLDCTNYAGWLERCGTADAPF